MGLLILGVVILVGIHLVPNFTALRQRLVQRLGENPYKGVFSAISLVGLILIIVGKHKAEFVPVWQPPVWGKDVAPLIMPAAFVLLAAAYLPTNIKRFTRHPMLWGITLWAAAHILANGDLASLVLFGGLGVFSLFAMWSANLRGAARSQTRHPLKKDIIGVAAGILVYGIFLFLHPYLFGVPAVS